MPDPGFSKDIAATIKSLQGAGQDSGSNTLASVNLFVIEVTSLISKMEDVATKSLSNTVSTPALFAHIHYLLLLTISLNSDVEPLQTSASAPAHTLCCHIAVYIRKDF